MTGSTAALRRKARLGEAAFHAGDIDPERLIFGSVVAAVAGVGDGLVEIGPDHSLDRGDDGGQGVAVIGVAG